MHSHKSDSIVLNAYFWVVELDLSILDECLNPSTLCFTNSDPNDGHDMSTQQDTEL